MLYSVLKGVLISVGCIAGLYGGLLFALTTQFIQSHAVYLHAFQMTGGKSLDTPEMFGFLRGQVVPFRIPSTDGIQLFSWLILPVGQYRKHEDQLCLGEHGVVSSIETTLAFSLLRNDPEALLVIHFHGAGGNVGSGFRIPNYKALSAAQPDKVFVLTFDYRGFGKTSGTPSEQGLIEDALAVVRWAIDTAKIDPSRILIFSQSMGTAVNMAVAERLAAESEAISFAGHILVAPFINVPTLAATYKIAGTIPILSPVARLPHVFQWLRSYIRDDWMTNLRIENYVRLQEKAARPYQITLIHAEDDYDIPWQHTPQLYQHAISASQLDGISPSEMEQHRSDAKQDLGPAGTVTRWKTSNGVITEHILKYGLHDVIMGNPIITAAAMDIFDRRYIA